MNPFDLALFLLFCTLGLAAAGFAMLILSMNPKLPAQSTGFYLCEFMCRLFIAMSAITGAMFVLVFANALLAPYSVGTL